MILPTKHIPQNEALIGVGATMLAHLTGPMTVSGLWERLRLEPNVGTFERFVLASNLLYLIGAIDIKDGLIVRTSS
jgi:ABC-three component (ABC-3C) system Middle Component 6